MNGSLEKYVGSALSQLSLYAVLWRCKSCTQGLTAATSPLAEQQITSEDCAYSALIHIHVHCKRQAQSYHAICAASMAPTWRAFLKSEMDDCTCMLCHHFPQSFLRPPRSLMRGPVFCRWHAETQSNAAAHADRFTFRWLLSQHPAAPGTILPSCTDSRMAAFGQYAWVECASSDAKPVGGCDTAASCLLGGCLVPST